MEGERGKEEGGKGRKIFSGYLLFSCVLAEGIFV